MTSTEQEQYLGFTDFDVHFTYGFLWRWAEGVPAAPLLETLFVEEAPSVQTYGWKQRLLHERVVDAPFTGIIDGIGSYQPTFVLKRRVLEHNGLLSKPLRRSGSENAFLVVPFTFGVKLP